MMSGVEHSSNREGPIEEWYRQPMVWMIIAIPLSAVLVGIVMLSLSISSFDGLVTDDYYKKGKQINRVLERDRYARAYNLSANLTINESGEVMVALEHEPGLLRPDQIELRFLHRTRSGFDRSVILDAVGSQHYRGQIEPLTRSHWLVQLETENWRVTGQATLPGNETIVLIAQ